MWPAGWTAEKGRAEHRNHMVSPSPTVPCTPASPREALAWGQYGLELTTAPVRHTPHSQPQRPTPGLATPEPRSRRSWVGWEHSSGAMTMSSGRGTEGSRVHLQWEPSDLQPAVTGGRLSRLLTGHWHRRGTSPVAQARHFSGPRQNLPQRPSSVCSSAFPQGGTRPTQPPVTRNHPTFPLRHFRTGPGLSLAPGSDSLPPPPAGNHWHLTKAGRQI